MGVYIRYLSEPIVQVGGPVANEAMIADGWFYYDGVIPNGDPLALIDGVLVYMEMRYGGYQNEADRYFASKKYLTNTDHKFVSDYEPYEGENLEQIKLLRSQYRAVCRAYEAKFVQPEYVTST